MATVGETALRAIAGNAALSFICDHNLDRTFNALAIANDNKTFIFALGTTLDLVKDETGKHIKDAVTQVLQAQEIKSSDPLAKYLEFDSVMRNQKWALNHAAEMIEADKKMPESKKAAAFAQLNAAPICTPPTSTIDSNHVAKKIELGIYLTKVMNSSVLDTWGPTSYGGMAGVSVPQRPLSEVAITQRPLAPDYPKNNLKGDGSGQSIGYTMTGDPFVGYDVVREQIDKLHKDLYKTEFYPKIGFFGAYGGEQKRAEIVKAEETLKRLGRDSQPPSLLGLAS